MQTLIEIKQVKNYQVKIYRDENGQHYFNCNCIYAKTNCISRGVPCKHTLSVIFTGGDCAKWEMMRNKYARYANLKSVSEAEIPLAKGLRSNDPSTIQWFNQNWE
jgi:hypothetical protein